MIRKTIQKATRSAPRTEAQLERDAKQIRRLERLIDVIFAILIWSVFQNLPIPSAQEFNQLSNLELTDKYLNSLIIIFIGIFFIITYWGQNNRVFGNLVRTDGRHAVLALLQICFLLLYLYSVIFEMEFTGHPVALAAQGVTLALSGFTAVIAWSYAKKNRRLLSSTISDEEAEQLKTGILAEPLAAATTIPFAFISPLAWNLSWLSLIVFNALLKKRHSRRLNQTTDP